MSTECSVLLMETAVSIMASTDTLSSLLSHGSSEGMESGVRDQGHLVVCGLQPSFPSTFLGKFFRPHGLLSSFLDKIENNIFRHVPSYEKM